MSSGRKTVPSCPVMAIFIGKHTFPGGQSMVNKISSKSGKFFFTFLFRNLDKLVFGLLQQSKFAGFGNSFCSQYTMDDVIVMQ